MFPLLLGILLFQPAHAEPKVGDRATYDVYTTMKDGKYFPSTKVAEIVQFDSETHRFLVRDTKKESGQPDQVTETWKGMAELFTDEKIEEILNGCEDAGGRAGLTWVPAGIFSACVLPVAADDVQPLSGRIWVARVRFGMARAEFGTKDGVTTVINLRSFQ